MFKTLMDKGIWYLILFFAIWVEKWAYSFFSVNVSVSYDGKIHKANKNLVYYNRPFEYENG